MSPSQRSRWLAATTALWLRPLAEVIPATRGGVLLARGVVATAMRIGGGLPAGTHVDRVDTTGPDGARVRGEWVRAAATSDARPVILYVHGSAFSICSPATHRSLVARLSRETGLPAFTVDYRLAPEHRHPAASDDVAAAYRWLLALGYTPDDIVLAGDSAGGHLILELLSDNARAGRTQPSAVVMMSPLIDLTLGLAQQRERVRRDPMISAAAARALVDHYIRDVRDDPRLVLDVDPAHPLPPTLIQAGGAEMLCADAEHAAEMIRRAGGPCRLSVWPGQMHVFQAFPRLVPEANRALAEAAHFITRVLTEPREDVADVRLAN
ncbi:alpha/beta hydrolase [uncultured Williamsia sp.]|uniref:alpha/beta hydrolase n=1 Tax=uncultured Williamsia sp. TaxID=259311 RepID=UPI00261C4A7F|nr:alpha/beta hydrolase [uncultured Williamsia sp.]